MADLSVEMICLHILGGLVQCIKRNINNDIEDINATSIARIYFRCRHVSLASPGSVNLALSEDISEKIFLRMLMQLLVDRIALKKGVLHCPMRTICEDWSFKDEIFQVNDAKNHQNKEHGGEGATSISSADCPIVYQGQA